jgi:hypothetical protein
VNTHLQLLWNSVFAPTAAVDLAKKHPNTYYLGWFYVAASIAAGFACELFARFIVRPLFGIVVTEETTPWAWIDTIAGLTTLSVVVSVILFLGQRVFWRKFANSAGDRSAIDAAIISGFALCLVIILPQYVLTEITQNSNGLVVSAVLLVWVAIYIGFSTVYFSHALNMSLAKSFGLNVLVFVLLMFSSIILFVVFFIAMSIINGTSLDVLFATQESVQ